MSKKQTFLFTFSLLFTLLFSQKSSAQEDLQIGQWKSYLSYPYGKYVTQSKEKIFFATESAIISFDKEDNTVGFLTKTEGLSDAGVRLVKYNAQSEILMVAYNNSNIDLMQKNGKVLNVRDILDNLNIIGDKSIYDIFIENGTTAYLACGFGVVKFNMQKGEFGFTTFTKGAVKSVVVHDGYVYAAAKNGLFRAPSNNAQLNLADFKNWSKVGKNQGFIDSFSCNGLAIFNNKLYADMNDTLFLFDNAQRQKIHFENNEYKLGFVNGESKHLLFSFIQKNDKQRWAGRFGYLNDKNQATFFQDQCIVHTLNAVEDEKGTFWMSDVERGFKSKSINGGACRVFAPNAPFSASVGEIAIANDNTVWVASGGLDLRGNRNDPMNVDGFYRLNTGKWTFRNRTNDTLMDRGYLYGVTTCNKIVVQPQNKKIYVASMWAGLLEVNPDGNVSKLYNNTNSILQRAVGDNGATRVAGLAFDKKGNLWVSNTLAPKPIAVLTPEGKWHSMGSELSQKGIYQCVVDPVNGYKWFIIGSGDGGLIVFDEGKDLISESDDRYAFINAGNSRLPSNKVNCLEVDLDGRIWVGTDNGVIYFSCGASVFEKTGNCKGFLPIATVDGIPEYLLKYNSVNTIAVDGANRKWLGTGNGFFIQSPDGVSEIAYFNVANSPLVDDNIIDIAINNKTGEAFIATGKGIQSFKSEALEGKVTHGTVVAYPNPVRPDYEGLIAIKGLAQDADVKITDINGRLVYETTALGGQAVWDGRDYNGRKVETGVYYVFSAYTQDVEYPDEAVTKILVVK